jgi:hypothetical protein
MGTSYGQSTITNVGTSIQLQSDGHPEMKPGGVTVDWSTITAVSADVTLDDGVTVFSGEKYLRYGQLLTMIGTAEVQTVTFTGGPTAGTATLTLPAFGPYDAETVVPIAFNATAQQFQDAFNAALPAVGPSGFQGLPGVGDLAVTVSVTGAGTAGSPYVYTLTFARILGNVPQLTSTNTFTGGTTPTVTHATTTAGAPSTNPGMYGPYDPAATDGRQTIERGRCFWVNETTRELDLHSNHPPVLSGGSVWRQRLIATTGTASLADGPTFTALEAAFPRLRYTDVN